MAPPLAGPLQPHDQQRTMQSVTTMGLVRGVCMRVVCAVACVCRSRVRVRSMSLCHLHDSHGVLVLMLQTQLSVTR